MLWGKSKFSKEKILFSAGVVPMAPTIKKMELVANIINWLRIGKQVMRQNKIFLS